MTDVLNDAPELIEWEDSFGCSTTWQEIGEVRPEPLICSSVGWIIHEDGHSIVIVPHVSQHGHNSAPQQACGDMTIPKSAIRNRHKLKGPDHD